MSVGFDCLCDRCGELGRVGHCPRTNKPLDILVGSEKTPRRVIKKVKAAKSYNMPKIAIASYKKRIETACIKSDIKELNNVINELLKEVCSNGKRG
jgi:hypothetical protein